MKKAFILFSFVFIVLFSHAQPMEISVIGNVTFDNSMFTITEAGNDYSSSIQTVTPVYVSLQYSSYWDQINNPNKKWRILVQKSNINWDSGLKLEICRSGKGDKDGKIKNKINGGKNYRKVTNTSKYFFKGKNEFSNVPLNFKLRGYSVTMGAEDFETNILLTVYDD